ncbi:hypothetical protein [Saccharothrix hoggarensis]|uniref:Uncharacterized protein n=1 Tax=Saccharothrix hoggarensis TaxID=913853 RepID=A0ABW3QGH5_9PSEU
MNGATVDQADVLEDEPDEDTAAFDVELTGHPLRAQDVPALIPKIIG